MKKMIICMVVLLGTLQYGCKKFLDITPIDKLTGNSFYKSKDDVEANITDMYGQLFDKYTKTSFAGATAEFRSGEVIPALQGGDSRTIYGRIGGHNRQAPDPLGSNDRVNIPTTSVNDRLLLEAIETGRPWSNFGVRDITVWNEYYRVIQSANLLVSKLKEGIPGLSADDRKRYDAEAKFIRCLVYFQMVRLYGDVVYYTAAFQKDPLPRMNMVEVINNCVDDLVPVKDNLPFTFPDPSLKGVRATRGSIIGLLMNLYMWNAGFDEANRQNYYQETAKLGEEIMSSNAYHLLPIEEWSTVSKGRSDESLFELFRTVNYNTNPDNPLEQANGNSRFGEPFIHFPYKQPEYTNRFSNAVFTENYMRLLYPDEGDGRLKAWFVSPFDQNVSTFQMIKFALNSVGQSGAPDAGLVSDETFLIIRYSDAILLYAEALANIAGKESQAIAALNVVRDRAGAPLYPSGSKDANLKDAIFIERAKELMGEGSRYFDLVRTKRVLSRAWTDNPLTGDEFARGAWTWPIDPSALSNNPYMVLNPYWIGSGF